MNKLIPLIDKDIHHVYTNIQTTTSLLNGKSSSHDASETSHDAFETLMTYLNLS